MSRLLAIAAGPRAKWVVLAAWLGAVFAFSALQLPSKFDKVQKNESTSFLPAKAESTKALLALEQIQSGSERVTMVVVYRNPSGLTAANRATINRARTTLNDLALPATKPFAPPVIAKDGTGALLVADIETNGDGKTITGPVEKVREAVKDPGGGLHPADRRRLRRDHQSLARIPRRQGRRHGQRAVILDPVDPRPRCRHRLRAAARRPISRGTVA